MQRIKPTTPGRVGSTDRRARGVSERVAEGWATGAWAREGGSRDQRRPIGRKESRHWLWVRVRAGRRCTGFLRKSSSGEAEVQVWAESGGGEGVPHFCLDQLCPDPLAPWPEIGVA